MQEINESTIELNKSIETMTNLFTYGHLHSRLLYFVIKHGVCDILEERGPVHYTEIAKSIKCDESSVYRVLRYFVPHGLFVEDRENVGTFNKTSCSKMFTKNGKLRDIVELQTHDIIYKLVESIPETLESNKSNSSNQVFNVDSFWDILRENKEFKHLFTNAMRGCTEIELGSILSRFDFSEFKTVVDLGGAGGLLIDSIVEKNPNVKGINFDMRTILETPTSEHRTGGVQNQQHQQQHQQHQQQHQQPKTSSPQSTSSPTSSSLSSSRIEQVSGSFFESVPEADCYILKHILHDWNDEDCCKILKTVSKHIRKGGRLFIFDSIMDPKNYTKLEVSMDILMMQLLNSKERTLNEWKHVIENSGFKVESVSHDTRPHCIVVSKKE